MRPFFFATATAIVALTAAAACNHFPRVASPTATIVCPLNATANAKLAAREVRRYVYLRTGELLPIASDRSDPTNQVIVLKADHTLGAQEFSLKSDGRSLTISGGSDVALLYGAYAFAEKLGVRFQIDGDVVPDEKIPFAIPKLDETHTPLFKLRGLQPFHDFPEGPDWWTTDDWKSVVAQTTKMRMNFIGLHTYPYHNRDLGPEPTVWIGLPEDVNPDGSVKTSDDTSWYTTAKSMPYGCYAPGKTRDYSFGAAQLYPSDDYGSEMNAPGDFPFPKTPDANVALINRVGEMFKIVFAEARQRGITTCVGTESPLDIPNAVKAKLEARGMDPNAPETLTKLYEGMFLRIKRAYPVDYYWIWGHEGEIDQKRFVTNIQCARNALKSLGDPFGLGICGWGWITGNFPALDKSLPKDVVFSAISMSTGHAPVSPNFSALEDRTKWAIPWLEDDGALGSIQLRAGRTRRDAVDAHAYGCDGLFGIFWRTRILGPNIGALAQAGWEQGAWSRPVTASGPKRDVSVAGGTTAAFLNEAVSGTSDDPVYQTLRYGMNGYRFTLPEGSYKVTLCFSEPVYREAGKRVFGVKLQGQKRLEHFDIFAKVGRCAALTQVFNDVPVKDGTLRVDFTHEVDYPLVCAIEVTGSGVTKKINCGGTSYQDYEADASSERLPRDLPTTDFYTDWATAQFGPQAGPAAAAIFAKTDGQFPSPTAWSRGPGAIVANRQPWSAVASQYAFVDEFAALRPLLKGKGSLERYNWWLNTFQATKAMGEAGCLRGALDAAMQHVNKETDPQARKKLAREKALPLRLGLLQRVSEISSHLILMVCNQTELGTLTNVEQQSLLRTKFLTGQDAALQAALGEPLPPEALPWKEYRGTAFLTVLTARSSSAKGETLTLPIIAMDKTPVKSVSICIRPMGHGDWQTIAARHIARAVWSSTLPPANEDFEYHVVAETASGTKLIWPATAPALNQTVVVND